jgi:glutamate N-acetyltransferase/amino-acid N-acetyltransferase
VPNQEVFRELNTIVQGFRAAAVAAGIKKDGVPDLALILSDEPAVTAGVFTKNKVRAAPVIVTEKHMRNGKARAIIANSGNANACSGAAGMEASRRTAKEVAEVLGVSDSEILIASTGVIGQPLNVDTIAAALPNLAEKLSPDGLPLAAQAIMTTDSFSKTSVHDGMAGGHPYRIAAIAKGAGMIMPDMATMLCFVLSDIAILGEHLQSALVAGVDKTFNRISVDGDTSTNDMVLVLANGAAGNKNLSDEEYQAFEKGLHKVMSELARMIVADGEGATKVVQIEVKGAATAADALRAARTVANSSLVKTAFYGQDANWGRIMAALGRAGITMEPNDVEILIDDIQIVAQGMGKGAEAEAEAAQKMKGKAFEVTIDLHQGAYSDRITTCDLTHEYVSINADYRT